MRIIELFESKDGKTTKYLQKTYDSHVIETGYYNLDEHVVCISTQVGCPMGCAFCATTSSANPLSFSKSFIRNLTAEEIIQQVKNIFSHLKKNNRFDTKKILFSYMGMGEPFLNYENVVKSIKVLSRVFPDSRTTVSTVGVNSILIKRLAHEKISTNLKLHLSLHASNDLLRRKILPKAQKIKSTLEALKYFSSVRGVLIKVNYILIKDLNDSQKHADQLARLLRNYSFIVKLSNLNDFRSLKSSNKNRFDIFEKTLNLAGIKTCKFISTGTDIKAGCGQLRRYYYNKKNL